MANSLEIDSSFIVSFLMFLLFNKTEILFALPFFFLRSHISLCLSLSSHPSYLEHRAPWSLWGCGRRRGAQVPSHACFPIPTSGAGAMGQ